MIEIFLIRDCNGVVYSFRSPKSDYTLKWNTYEEKWRATYFNDSQNLSKYFVEYVKWLEDTIAD